MCSTQLSHLENLWLYERKSEMLIRETQRSSTNRLGPPFRNLQSLHPFKGNLDNHLDNLDV